MEVEGAEGAEGAGEMLVKIGARCEDLNFLNLVRTAIHSPRKSIARQLEGAALRACRAKASPSKARNTPKEAGGPQVRRLLPAFFPSLSTTEFSHRHLVLRG